jgi:hypothetical protein
MTLDLTVIIPSRGRPASAVRLMGIFERAKRATVIFCVDEDDPTAEQYPKGFTIVGPPKRLVPWLNEVAPTVTTKYVGFMGDDHLPLTPDFDALLCDALDEMTAGMVYGDDLLQGENLCTAVFLSKSIVDALGFMVPPQFVHMAIDLYWHALGQALGILRYLPNVVIEHRHHSTGKSPFDAANQASEAVLYHDNLTWRRYRIKGDFDADVMRVRDRLGLP